MTDDPSKTPPMCGHCGMPWMVRPGETYLDDLAKQTQSTRALAAHAASRETRLAALQKLAQTNPLQPKPRADVHAEFVAEMTNDAQTHINTDPDTD